MIEDVLGNDFGNLCFCRWYAVIDISLTLNFAIRKLTNLIDMDIRLLLLWIWSNAFFVFSAVLFDPKGIYYNVIVAN